MAGSTSHPTRERLIDTMISLLDQKAPDHISVDEVLNVSGISKGSLYHHFEDFSDLLEVAYLRRFAAFVDESSESITEVIATSTSREEMLTGLRAITRRTQAPDLASLRLERLRAIGLAGGNERFRVRLAVEQQRLTDALADLVRESQLRGWFRSDYSPNVLAVFVQAYTLGRVLDEIAESPVDNEEWVAFIDHMLSATL
jgi:AcrR family transcriptional regulator